MKGHSVKAALAWLRLAFRTCTPLPPALELCTSNCGAPSDKAQLAQLAAQVDAAELVNAALRRELDDLKKKQAAPTVQYTGPGARQTVAGADRRSHTPEGLRLRADLSRARDTIRSLEQQLATVQAANETAYRADYDRTGGPCLDPNQPFGTGRARAERYTTEAM